MKAITYHEYGPPEVLKLSEVSKPIPKENQVLIKIRAVAVNMGDCELRSPKIPNSIWLIVRLFFGVFKPRKKVLGAYLAGDIESVGSSVTSFKIGDPVFACSGPRFGAYAEYMCLPEDDAIAPKPENLNFEEASVLGLGLDALHFLRMASVQKGQKVLVNGAGGGIGTIAVQLAKYYGAEVTAVDNSTKLEMLQSIGADHVIDYTKESFDEQGVAYDVIFDLVGKGSYSKCIHSLSENGIYLLANPSGIGQMFRGLWTTMTSKKKVISKFADASKEDMLIIKELVESGAIKPVIDKTMPFEKVVETHTYVESGQKLGNVVLTVAN